jgi:prolyl 4-hydroxylase
MKVHPSSKRPFGGSYTKLYVSLAFTALFLFWIFYNTEFIFERSAQVEKQPKDQTDNILLTDIAALKDGELIGAKELFNTEEISYVVLHEQSPRVLYVRNFLSDAECDELIALAMPTFKRSTVAAGRDNQMKDSVNDVRTSSGAWLSRYDTHESVKAFTRRVSLLSGVPTSHGEDIQILQYEIGQRYEPHSDYFEPNIYKKYLENGGQRVATVLCFLNDVEEGGETAFPGVKLEVKPKKGSAILWYNVTPDGQLDSKSMHGGMPVKKGIKYVAVQWMREKERK